MPAPRTTSSHECHIGCTVAPPVEKPVDVLTKLARAVLRELRCAPLLFICQKCGFKNNLALRIAIDTLFDNGPYITKYEFIVAAFKRTHVDYHVDLACTIANGAPGFHGLDLRLVGSQRETHDRACKHLAATQQTGRQ